MTDDQIRAYTGLVEHLAKRFVGRNGAELDDLVQEGLINVWQTLERGIVPSADIIVKRMSDYVAWLGRRYPVPYEQMLPLDDFSEALALG